MSNDNYQNDAAIIHAAYAEKVKDSWKIFAENLAMGENDRGARERFLRSLDFIRKAREMALEGMRDSATVEATTEVAAAADRTSPEAVAAAADDGLSAEERTMIEQALAGTTGQRAATPLPNSAARSPLMRR